MMSLKYLGQLNTGIGRIFCPFQSAHYSRIVSQSIQQKLGLPEAPKRPLTPFLKYVMQQRPEVLKENPKLKQPEIIKKISSSWKQLDASAKKPMEDEFKNEFSEYMKQSQKYMDSLSAEKHAQIKRAVAEAKEKKHEKQLKTDKKNLGQPKRPVNAFSLFLKEKLSHTGSKSTRETLKKLAEEWKSCPEQEKQRLTKKYEEDKRVYDKAMQEWEKKMLESGRNDLLRRGSEALKMSTLKSPKRGAKEETGTKESQQVTKGRGKKRTVEKK